MKDNKAPLLAHDWVVAKLDVEDKDHRLTRYYVLRGINEECCAPGVRKRAVMRARKRYSISCINGVIRIPL
jgi:hypothetical protein